jgi:hypothetical protein
MGNTNVPYDGAVPVTSGNGILAGSIFGANVHTLTEAQLAAHTHSFSATSGAGSAHTHGLGTLATVSGGGENRSICDRKRIAHHQRKRVDTTTLTATAGGGTVIATVTNVLEATDNASNSHTHNVTTSNHTHTISGAPANESAHTHSVSGTSAPAAPPSTHNNLQRSVPVTVLMKL